jgi:hypothetical protein
MTRWSNWWNGCSTLRQAQGRLCTSSCPRPRPPHEQESLQRQTAATDHQIDALVHELYGLMEEEIEAVEG